MRVKESAAVGIQGIKDAFAKAERPVTTRDVRDAAKAALADGKFDVFEAVTIAREWAALKNGADGYEATPKAINFYARLEKKYHLPRY